MESRRNFIKSSAALAMSAAAGSKAFALGANDRINIGLIGGRAQGRAVAQRMIGCGARIRTFCDIDSTVLAEVGAKLGALQGVAPQTATDFRRVLDDPSIDAVLIATPDHWHTHMALLACQAGKDVYVEKPLSQTIREGQLIRDAARKYKRVVQVGTQRRSMEHYQRAAEYVASGKLGKLCLVKAWMCQVRGDIGNPPDTQAPSTVDYDRWLGPAPLRPFNPNRFHYNWRFFWDYGNSELGNQGVHLLDVALMGIQKSLGREKCLPTNVAGHGGIYWLKDAKEVPDTQVITYDYGEFLLTWELRSFAAHHPMEGVTPGTAFYGTEGTLVADTESWRVFDKTPSATPILTVKASGGSHEQNFLDCLRSRKLPAADVEVGRLSTTLAHLGNISHRLNRSIRFNPVEENFGEDREANAMLEKKYRSSYPLPSV